MQDNTTPPGPADAALPAAERPRHGWLYALPAGRMPARVTADGRTFTLVETFKHDFFAATGLYQDDAGTAAVLKLGRRTSLFGLPLAWLGRFLARREMRLYAMTADLPEVPDLIGPVGDHGFLHAFVPGRPLRRRDSVDDAFFNRLSAALEKLHERHIAYVDLDKKSNVLLGDDGRPYLIDFQISLHLPPRGWWRLRTVQWLLHRFQDGDRYHLLKHKRRLRPDLLTSPEQSRLEPSVLIRLHRLWSRPLTQLRRIVLRRLRRSETAEVAGSSSK